MFLIDVNSFWAIQQMCLVVAMSLGTQQTCLLRRWIGVWADICRKTLGVVLHSTRKGWWWGDWWNCNSPCPDLRLLCSYGVSSLSPFAVVVLYFQWDWYQSKQKLPALPGRSYQRSWKPFLFPATGLWGLLGLNFLYDDTKCSLSSSAS